MDNFTNDFINWIYFKFIFAAIFIFLFFRILRLITPTITDKKETRKKFYRFQPLTELFVWLFYFVWAIPMFMNRNQYYSIGLFLVAFILVLLITWYILRDFIAGVVFRFSQRVSRHEVIKLQGYIGRIIRYRPFSLEIETDTGERIIIPYSTLLGQTIIKTHPAERILNYTFQLKTPTDVSLSETIRKIREHIYNLPWSSIKKEPQIKLIGEDNQHFVFEITTFSFDENFFYPIENNLKKKFFYTPDEVEIIKTF